MFRHKAFSELRTQQNLKNNRTYGISFRVKFTLTKFQKTIGKQSRDELLLLTKSYTQANKEEHFNFRKHQARQIDYQGLCKRCQITTSLDGWLYGYFKYFWTFSTFSLKDECVLLLPLILSSRTSRLKILKVMPQIPHKANNPNK